MNAVLACWLLALALPLPRALGSQSIANRWRRAQIELEGPLEAVRVLDGPSESVLEVRLARGERRALAVPLAVEAGRGAPELVCHGAGTARFVGWDEPFESDSTAWWESLPAGLRARGRPVVGGAAGDARRAPFAALLLTLASLPLVVALRRRPWRCAACSLVLATAVGFTAARGAEIPEPVRVLEGDGTARRWMALDCARDCAQVAIAETARLEVAPHDAPLMLRLAADAPTASVEARGARLWLLQPCDPGQRRFSRGANAWGRLDECWWREADGAWTARGAWDVGAELPAADAAREQAPPGWINPALPQGVGVLIGRLATGAFAGAPGSSAQVWVRVVDP